MADRQIQPVRRDLQIVRQTRQRGLPSQVFALALQPNTFFRTLPQVADARQWFWVAALILALVGFAGVREETLRSGGEGAAGGGFTPPVEAPPISDPFGSPFGGGPGVGAPPEVSSPTSLPPAGTGGDISSTWVTALISAAHIVLGWFILSVMLSEVSLFNGEMPSLSQNFQIAIWTTVPLAILAGLQLVFWGAGGQPGAPGLAGLLPLWEGFDGLPDLARDLLYSLASRTTLFWLWSLVLIYVAGRTALNGKGWAVLIVVFAWAIVLTVAPVVTGAIAAPERTTPPEQTGALEGMTPPQGIVPGEFAPDGTFSPAPGADGSFTDNSGGAMEGFLQDGAPVEGTLPDGTPLDQAAQDEAAAEATPEATAGP